VSVEASPHARFRRALERGNLLEAEAAARELRGLSLADALSFCMLLARKDPRRFERAAVRWHGRFELEVRELALADSQLSLAALAALRTDPGNAEAQRLLADVAGRLPLRGR